MDQPIVRTKIIAPRRRSELLTRPRLLDTLRARLDYKLMLLVAPAGYGKTYLMIDLAGDYDAPICWYAADQLDRDPYRFFAHFIAAIAYRFPDFGAQSMSILQSLPGGQGDIDQLLVILVNDLYEHVQERFVLVIDDYYLLDGNTEIDYFISQFVQRSGENCHLVLASRTQINLPDQPLMIARSLVGYIDFYDLAFRPDEVQALALQNYGQSLSDEDARALFHATEGWITGLLMSAQSGLHVEKGGRSRLLRATNLDLYDYLAQQVLASQPQSIQAFLLHTSVFEEFDAELCQAVLGEERLPAGENWQGLISTVLENLLFVLPVGEEGLWLRYHHLFQEFLQTELRRNNPHETASILRRVATHYTEYGQWEQAYLAYRRLDDDEATVRLIERAGQSLISAGRTDLLRQWLDAVPDAVLANRPKLLSLQGVATAQGGRVQDGLELFNQAADLQRGRDISLDLAQTLVWRAVAYRLLGRYCRSMDDADRALSLIEEIGYVSLEVQDVFAQALRSKGLVYYVQGELSNGIVHLKEALSVSETLSDDQFKAMIRMEIGLIHLGLGQLQKALTLSSQSQKTWYSLNNLLRQANALNNLGVIYHQLGNYEQGIALLAQSLNLAVRTGHKLVEATALASIGDILTDLEFSAAAQHTYDQAHVTASQHNQHRLLLLLEINQARLACVQVAWEQARIHLETIRTLVSNQNSNYQWGLYHFATGYYYLSRGKITAAVATLEDAFQRLSASDYATETTIAQFYLSAALKYAHNNEKAQASLTQALQQFTQLESKHAIAIEVREIRTTLSQIGKGAPCIRRDLNLLFDIIDRFEQHLPATRRHVRRRIPGPISKLVNLQPKITLNGLGRTEVLIYGQVVTTAKWKTLVSRDLFFYLIAHPDGLSKEEIGEQLWPDCPPAQLQTRFKNTIYRLRRAVGTDAIVLKDEVYRVNRALDYEYDVENFVNYVRSGVQADNQAEKRSAYETAVQIYRGDYLVDVDDTWVWSERQRIRRMYIDTAHKLVQLNIEEERFDDALEVCQSILAKDPCLEEAHRLAMRIHAANGNRAAIVRQYRLCQRVLQEEIDAPPSSQTEELYHTLMR